MVYQVDLSKTRIFLEDIIKKRLDEKELPWYDLQKEKLKGDSNLSYLYLTFSLVPRFIRKAPLKMTQEELAHAANLRTGFQPETWNLAQSVRIYILLALPSKNEEDYVKNIARLFETADMDEQVALYKALPLLPFPRVMAKRATEGIRTNITDVFDAIALQNPYPHDFLDQNAWNQMILKAVFMQRPLYRIYGAGERSNSELARMLIDFAHERWAANRTVIPELWRFVGPFLNNESLADIHRVLEGDLLEKNAGLLACSMSNFSEAKELLEKFPDVQKEIETGRLNWNIIGKKNEEDLLK